MQLLHFNALAGHPQMHEERNDVRRLVACCATEIFGKSRQLHWSKRIVLNLLPTCGNHTSAHYVDPRVVSQFVNRLSRKGKRFVQKG